MEKIKKEVLAEIIRLHGLWSSNKAGGVRADLSEANLCGANLLRANLCGANLLRANLSEANLSRANLSGADLSGANLRWANLCGADLSRANLSGADLSGADLSEADLSRANLRWANLSRANLRWADLSRANLSRADLREAILRGADLSQVKGILLAREWLNLFETDELGVIVYRAQQGENTHPAGWNFEPGAFLTEIPNPDRCTLCGCGVAFATLAWVRENYPNGVVWKCRIRWIDLADVVVPFGTDGKARCARLELIEKLEAPGDRRAAEVGR